MNLQGKCRHCGKNLNKQNGVKVAGEKVFCNQKCSQRINYAVVGKDGYTRVSSRKENLPKNTGNKIVEIQKDGVRD